MKSSLIVLLSGLSAAAIAGVAIATPIAISNGASSGTTARDCSAPGSCIESVSSSFAGTGVQNLLEYNPGGVSASTTATNTLAIIALGTSGSSVQIRGNATLAPLANQGAFANGSNARVSGQTYSVTGYSRNGTCAASRSITLSLDCTGTNVIDGTLLAPNTGPYSALTVFAEIFSLPAPTFVVSDQNPQFQPTDSALSTPAEDCTFLADEICTVRPPG